MTVGWPDKMITQAEAFNKAASWPIMALNGGDYVTNPPGEIILCCGKPKSDGKLCGQSMGQLLRGGIPYNGSLDEMLSMVLRHMVMAHDVPLNTRPRPGEADVKA